VGSEAVRSELAHTGPPVTRRSCCPADPSAVRIPLRYDTVAARVRKCVNS